MIRDIRRATRRHFSAEEKIRIVFEGLRGEESIAELCRRARIATLMYYGWSKEFLKAGKRRRAGDTTRAATLDEVKALRREVPSPKESSPISRSRTVCSKKHERGWGERGMKPIVSASYSLTPVRVIQTLR
jgi:transposase-like protein